MKHSVARIAQQSRRVAAKGWEGEDAHRAALSPSSVLSIQPRGSEIERNGSDSWQCNCSFKVASLLLLPPRLFRRSTYLSSSSLPLSLSHTPPQLDSHFGCWAKIDPSERERERESLHSRRTRDKSLMKVNSIKLDVPFPDRSFLRPSSSFLPSVWRWA